MMDLAAQQHTTHCTAHHSYEPIVHVCDTSRKVHMCKGSKYGVDWMYVCERDVCIYCTYIHT